MAKKYKKAIEEQVALHSAFGAYADHLRLQVASGEIDSLKRAERLEALDRVIDRHAKRVAKIVAAEKAKLPN